MKQINGVNYTRTEWKEKKRTEAENRNTDYQALSTEEKLKRNSTKVKSKIEGK